MNQKNIPTLNRKEHTVAMSQKHYEQVADILKVQVDLASSDPERGQLRRIAVDLAAMFAADNPRFDRDRFMEAAGIR